MESKQNKNNTNSSLIRVIKKKKIRKKIRNKIKKNNNSDSNSDIWLNKYILFYSSLFLLLIYY